MGRKKAAGATPAIAVLTGLGIEFTVHRYDHDPRAESFGHEAVEALGLPPERVFKTLLATVDDRLVVAVVPVTGQLDLKGLARAVGGSRAHMADPAEAQRATGYLVGGISPVGQKRPHPTVIEASAANHSTIHVSAGRRGMEVELAPADLLRATGASLADIGRP